jgi:SPP1 family predicted phage head-tail adaptor
MKQKQSLTARLRHRITIENLVETPDGAGGFVSSWTSVATVWAELLPITANVLAAGSEVLNDMQIENKQGFRITLRFMSGITAKMRITHNGRVFNIRRVVNVNERNEALEIFAEEGVAI